MAVCRELQFCYQNLLETREFFVKLVHGIAKIYCTVKGGGRVDVDSDPLSIGPLWQNALFLGQESATCSRLPRLVSGIKTSGRRLLLVKRRRFCYLFKNAVISSE